MTCLVQGNNACSASGEAETQGSNLQPLNLESNTLTLSHHAPLSKSLSDELSHLDDSLSVSRNEHNAEQQ